jgi:hypothetical protein
MSWPLLGATRDENQVATLAPYTLLSFRTFKSDDVQQILPREELQVSGTLQERADVSLQPFPRQRLHT